MIFLMKVRTMIFSQHGNGYHVGGNILGKVESSES